MKQDTPNTRGRGRRQAGRWIPTAAWLLALASALPLPGQDPAAERLFGAAERLEQAGDPIAANREYQLLFQRFPADRWAATALLRHATLSWRLGEEAAARDSLAELGATHGRLPEAAHGLLLEAEMELTGARGQAGLEAVRTLLRRIPILFGREAYPGLSARGEALRRSAELGLRLGDPAGAAAEALRAIEDEVPGPQRPAAQLSLARAFLDLGDLEASLEIMGRLADAGSVDARAGDPGVAAAAGRLQALVHRRHLAPAAGRAPWSQATPFGLTQLGIKGVESIAAAEDGRLLLVDSRQQLVALLAPDGALLERRELDKVGRAWFGPDGQPYVVGREGVHQPFSGAAMQFADPLSDKPRNLEDLVAAEQSPLGDWYLLTRKAKGLYTYQDRRKGRGDLLATADLQLLDLARDAAGRIHVLDGKGNRVLRLDASGDPTIVARGDWKRPTALTVDALGYLFLLDRGERQLIVHGPDGQVLRRWGPELGADLALRSPEDLAVDGSGRLYIADSKLPYLVLVE